MVVIQNHDHYIMFITIMNGFIKVMIIGHVTGVLIGGCIFMYSCSVFRVFSQICYWSSSQKKFVRHNTNI